MWACGCISLIYRIESRFVEAHIQYRPTKKTKIVRREKTKTWFIFFVRSFVCSYIFLFIVSLVRISLFEIELQRKQFMFLWIFIECEINADRILMMSQHVVILFQTFFMLQLCVLIIAVCLIEKKQITTSFAMKMYIAVNANALAYKTYEIFHCRIIVAYAQF